MMQRENWKLCGGPNLPLDVLQHLTDLTKLLESARLLAVQTCVELMEMADALGIREVADAAQACGFALSDVAVPVVEAREAGTA